MRTEVTTESPSMINKNIHPKVKRMNTGKRKKTPKYVEKQRWDTMMMVDDELVDRINIWHFYYFAAVSIVPLLENFRDVAEFMESDRPLPPNRRLPETYITADYFDKMIAGINLLIEYYSEEGLIYGDREINFERGDRITELTDALHHFANLLPYLNDRHFKLSAERYDNLSHGKHCDFPELCNLDKTIARRIFPTLQAFAAMSIFTPRYFKQMYHGYPLPDSSRTKDYNFCDEWDKALDAMVESWRWIKDRIPVVTQDGWEDVPEKIYHGLHLFAEYLPEMQND